MDPAKMAPVRALKERTPATIGELRQMLGFISYYRPFIQNFSKVALPLYNLLTVRTIEEQTPDPQTERHKKTVKKKKGHLPSRTPIQWTSFHQHVLNQLVEALTKPPVLGYPDFTQPFVLYCDAWVGCCVVSASARKNEGDSVWLAYPEPVRKKVPPPL